MKSASFIDFSSWIIQHADRNMLDEGSIFRELTANFWSATKVRQQRWNALIAELEPQVELAKADSRCWEQLSAVCDEIVLSETVSRVWFAVIISKTSNDDIIDVAQCIIPDHMRVGQRAMSLWENVPKSVVEIAERTIMVKAIRDQANDLMLSQISEEVVGRNLSICFETFDNFFACRCEYEPAVLLKANRVLSKSYSKDISRLSPFDCVNADLNLKILISICNSFDGEDIELPAIVTESAVA